MATLRLFQITDTAASGKNKAIPELFFSDKQKAKDERRRLNATAADGTESLRYVVSPGPDHHHYDQRS